MKQLFVFDKLTINLPDVFDQFFQPLKEQHNHNTRGSQQSLLNIAEINTQMFCSNSIKIKSIKDCNEIICKIHFSYVPVHVCAVYLLFLSCRKSITFQQFLSNFLAIVTGLVYTGLYWRFEVTFLYVCIFMPLCMYTCICMYIYIYIYIYMCM